MFPNYVRAPNGAEAKPVSQLYESMRFFLLDVKLFIQVFFP